MADPLRDSQVERRLEEILQSYGHFLRGLIGKLCPAHLGIQHDDLEQEARIRIWRALKGEREIRNLPSYIHRIAVTTTIDAIRRVRARREEQMESARDGESPPPSARSAVAAMSPERQAEQRETVRTVQRELKSLARDRARAVGLYLQGMGSREIAGLLDWSEPKARNLLYRGLKDLKTRLVVHGIEYETDG